MSVAVNVWVAFGLMRRQVRSGVVDTDAAPDIQNITPLDVFFSKYRAVKYLIPYSSLPINYLEIFYEKLYIIILIMGPKHSCIVCRIIMPHGSSV